MVYSIGEVDSFIYLVVNFRNFGINVTTNLDNLINFFNNSIEKNFTDFEVNFVNFVKRLDSTKTIALN